MNILLNVFTDFWNNFLQRLSMPSIIFALVFAIIGVSLAVIARRVAVVVRKSKDIDEKDPIMIGLKAVGLACLFVSVLIIVIRVGV